MSVPVAITVAESAVLTSAPGYAAPMPMPSASAYSPEATPAQQAARKQRRGKKDGLAATLRSMAKGSPY